MIRQFSYFPAYPKLLSNITYSYFCLRRVSVESALEFTVMVRTLAISRSFEFLFFWASVTLTLSPGKT